MNEKPDAAPPVALHVAALAPQLHQEGGLGMRVDLPADSVLGAVDLPSGCKLVEGVIEFNSLAERNNIVAKAAFESLRSSPCINPGALFERGYELWRDEILIAFILARWTQANPLNDCGHRTHS